MVLLIISDLSYRFVELPFWKGKWHNLADARIFGAAGLCVAIMLLGVTLPRWNGSATEANGVPDIAELERSWRLDVPMLYQYPCDTWYESAEVVSCDFGEAGPEKTIVLFGDSIAAQWFSLFAESFVTKGWKLKVLTKSACPIVDEPYHYERIGKRFEICEQWRSAATEAIVTARPHWIVIGSSLDYPFSATQWREGTKRAIDQLSASGASVSILLGTPLLGFDGPGCVAR